MNTNRIIRILRIWSPDSSKIKQKYFLKNEILFGSDKTADIRLEETSGFFARLDFDSREMRYLDEDRVEKLEPGELIQIKSFVFQWKEMTLFKREWRWSAAALAAGLVFILLVHLFSPGTKQHCSPRAERLSSGAWGYLMGDLSDQAFFQNLNDMKKSFQLALKAKQWAKARTELDSIKTILEQENAQTEHCHLDRPLEGLEAQFSRSLIVDYLRELNVQAAADEIRRFKGRFQSEELDRFESRVLRAAQKIYLEGYRLEDEDPEKASELMEKAEQTCLLLNREPQCFRASKTQAN